MSTMTVDFLGELLGGQLFLFGGQGLSVLHVHFLTLIGVGYRAWSSW